MQYFINYMLKSLKMNQHFLCNNRDMPIISTLSLEILTTSRYIFSRTVLIAKVFCSKVGITCASVCISLHCSSAEIHLPLECLNRMFCRSSLLYFVSGSCSFFSTGNFSNLILRAVMSILLFRILTGNL